MSTPERPPVQDPRLPVPGEHLDENLTVPAFVRRLAAEWGDRPAIVFGEETLSFRQLHQETLRFERALLGLGATKGTRVALLMGNRPEFVIAAFAAMGIGAVVCPISTYEPAARRDDLLRHSDASIFILQDGLLKHDYLGDFLRDHPGVTDTAVEPWYDDSVPHLRHVVHLGDDRSGGRLHAWDELLSQSPPVSEAMIAALEASIHPTDDALIVYTSGTSGVPKGVLHAHRSPAIQFPRLPHQFSMTSDDVAWGTFPFFWSAGLAWLLGAALGIGAKLVLQEWFDPVVALDLIEKHGVTVIQATPPEVSELEAALETHPVDVSSLRIIPRGSFVGRVSRPPDAPWGGASLGLSETMTLAASEPWDGPLELRMNTNGRPLPGTFMKVVDTETRETLPTGEHGEVALKGTTLMKGYNKRFPETYLDGDGYYLTGDGGFFDDDGYLHWTGRITQMIRTNSANVSPMEVEQALYELPSVKVAAVLGAPDAEVGEVVVACVVPQPGVTVTQEDVRTQLADRLASYKIPRRVLFLDESELEMTGTGKARLASLRQLVAERLSGD